MKAFLIVKYKDVIGEILPKGTPFDRHTFLLPRLFSPVAAGIPSIYDKTIDLYIDL